MAFNDTEHTGRLSIHRNDLWFEFKIEAQRVLHVYDVHH